MIPCIGGWWNGFFHFGRTTFVAGGRRGRGGRWGSFGLTKFLCNVSGGLKLLGDWGFSFLAMTTKREVGWTIG